MLAEIIFLNLRVCVHEHHCKTVELLVYLHSNAVYIHEGWHISSALTQTCNPCIFVVDPLFMYMYVWLYHGYASYVCFALS